MATKRGPAVATAAALLAIVAAAVAGCGQARVGTVPAGSTGSTGNTGSAGGTGSAGSGAGGAGRTVVPGTATPSPAGTATTAVRVCADPAAVQSVVVTRIPGLTEPGPPKPGPAVRPSITISNRGRAVGLARVICALPEMPRGVLSCPIDIGGGYDLVFHISDLRMPTVTIRASGCEMVQGASQGRPRWIPASPGFWPAFSRLTGIKDPAHHP